MTGFSIVQFHLTDVSEALFTVLLFLVVITVVRIAIFHVTPLMHSVPESAIIILVGSVFGFGLWAAHVGSDSVLRWNHEIFFLVLIPPIIFEAGWCLEKDFFFHNLGMILFFAVIGTGLNTLLIWAALFLLRSAFPFEIAWFELAAFASLVSAVDPVAVLAIFHDIHVNKTLNVLVFGESVLNDAVSIVLYNFFISLREVDSVTVALPFLAIVKFFVVCFGGIGLGVLLAFAASFTTRFTSVISLVEPLICGLSGYVAFVLAEVLGLSGIMAILFCAMFLSRYAAENMNPRTLSAFKQLIKLYSSTTETLVFIYLGITTIFQFFVSDNPDRFCVSLILCSLFFVFVFRFVVIFSLTFLGNRFRYEKIDWRTQVIISYSGLRGAIAFALAFVLPPDLPSKAQLLIATLFIVHTTIFLQGTTIRPFLRVLKIRRQNSRAEGGKMTVAEQTWEIVFSKSIPMANQAALAIVGRSFFYNIRQHVWAWADRILQRILLRDLLSEEQALLLAMHRLEKASMRGYVEHHDREIFRQAEKSLQQSNVNLERVIRKHQNLTDKDRERLERQSMDVKYVSARGAAGIALAGMGLTESEEGRTSSQGGDSFEMRRSMELPRESSDARRAGPPSSFEISRDAVFRNVREGDRGRPSTSLDGHGPAFLAAMQHGRTDDEMDRRYAARRRRGLYVGGDELRERLGGVHAPGLHPDLAELDAVLPGVEPRPAQHRHRLAQEPGASTEHRKQVLGAALGHNITRWLQSPSLAAQFGTEELDEGGSHHVNRESGDVRRSFGGPARLSGSLEQRNRRPRNILAALRWRWAGRRAAKADEEVARASVVASLHTSSVVPRRKIDDMELGRDSSTSSARRVDSHENFGGHDEGWMRGGSSLSTRTSVSSSSARSWSGSASDGVEVHARPRVGVDGLSASAVEDLAVGDTIGSAIGDSGDVDLAMAEGDSPFSVSQSGSRLPSVTVEVPPMVGEDEEPTEGTKLT